MRPILKHNINEDDSDEDSGDGISGAKRLRIPSALRDTIMDSPLDVTTEYEEQLEYVSIGEKLICQHTDEC